MSYLFGGDDNVNGDDDESYYFRGTRMLIANELPDKTVLR